MALKWSKKSQANIDLAHKDLQNILNAYKTFATVDISIVETARSFEIQKKYLKDGKTKTLNSKHLLTPAEAFDIRVFVKGKPNLSYDTTYLSHVAGVLLGIAEILYLSGVNTHRLCWGGNWDMDGEIITDQNFQDLCHFELAT